MAQLSTKVTIQNIANATRENLARWYARKDEW